MLKPFDAYRSTEMDVFIGDQAGNLNVSLTILERMFYGELSKPFHVESACFHHPDGIQRRTFSSPTDTCFKDSLEALVKDWLQHFPSLPQDYSSMVRWIEASPDPKALA